MKTRRDFADTFAMLKRSLKRHAKACRVTADNAEAYMLESKIAKYNGKPVYFAGVRLGKAYVSYHLVPIYLNPKLAAGISSALKKHMQGKACFNFKAPDKALFKELDALTATCAKALPKITLA